MPVSPDPFDPYQPVYFNNYTFSVTQSSYGQVGGANFVTRSYDPEGFQTATVNGEVISGFNEDVTITSQIYSGPLTYQGQNAGADGYYVYYFLTNTSLGISLTYGAIPQGMTYYVDGGNYAQPDPVCFCSGTLILTSRGEVAVEDLQAGDVAITASGAGRSVVWVGRRFVVCEAASNPERLWPVRVRAGTFADNMPARDLYLSGGHAVCPPGSDVLIPIEHLINGDTVARAACRNVTYWHVELDMHGLLLAEGLAAESFIDVDIGDREWFENGDTVETRRLSTYADMCVPYFVEWDRVDAIKAVLLQRGQGCLIDA